jgi:hypothetical protein
VTTISGNAIKVRGKPDTYRALNLTDTFAPTLFFTPTDYELHDGTAEFVRPGDEVTWAEQNFKVLLVDAIAPDGVVIAARIVIAR